MEDHSNNIPRRLNNFFRWFCHPDYIEELEGDLLENFNKNVKMQSLAHAKAQYRKEIIRMIRWSVMRDINPANMIKVNPALFRSHGRVAIRNINRHKVFSIINITGLAIGMTVGLLIISLMSHLLNFDHFHDNKHQIFRVTTKADYNHRRDNDLATAPLPLVNAMRDNVGGIDEIVRIRRSFSAEAKANNKILPIKGHLVDPQFFEIFTFPLLSGDAQTALVDPFSIVITKKAAVKFFGNADPIGQMVKMGSYGEYKINGVLEDIPLNSHLQFEVLGSFSTLPSLEKNEIVRPSIDQWDDVYSNYIYFTTQEGQNIEEVESRLNSLSVNEYDRYNDLDVSIVLQPLLGIVPGPELSNKIGPTMTPLPLLILSTIALLILLSACFNYTNLSIARALRRSREVGVRKVVGASKGEVVLQFLVESVLIALVALLISIGFFHLIRPGFYNIIPRADQFNLSINPGVLISFIIFAIVSGILAGIFPSIFLSRIKPVVVLKNMMSEKHKANFTIRKVLITFQFTISMIFIIGASIVLKQYRFAINKDLGFDKAQVLNVDLYDTDFQVFKNEFSKIPEVTTISFSSLIAGLGSTSTAMVQKIQTLDSARAYYMSIDQNYIDNHSMTLLAGRNFESAHSKKDSRSIIINQTLLEYLELDKSRALAQWAKINGIEYQIIGIVENFNYTHLEEPIDRFFFLQDEAQYSVANLKIKSADISKTMARLDKKWISLEPTNSFSASFLKDQIDRAYSFLKDAMTLFGFLGFLAITISCLGMLGMAMYAAESKAKEVSIRKIFGASVWNIFHSLSMRFYVLILLAALFSSPIVYLLFDKVILANFAFRVQIGPLELLSGLAIVFLLGMLSIGTQTWRVARVNPAESLRNL